MHALLNITSLDDLLGHPGCRLKLGRFYRRKYNVDFADRRHMHGFTEHQQVLKSTW